MQRLLSLNSVSWTCCFQTVSTLERFPLSVILPLGQVLVEIEEYYKAYPLKNSNGSDSINIAGF